MSEKPTVDEGGFERDLVFDEGRKEGYAEGYADGRFDALMHLVDVERGIRTFDELLAEVRRELAPKP